MGMRHDVFAEAMWKPRFRRAFARRLWDLQFRQNPLNTDFRVPPWRSGTVTTPIYDKMVLDSA